MEMAATEEMSSPINNNEQYPVIKKGLNNLSSGPTETELATKILQIQSKRFYLDVKENMRGKFIKVAEIAADGRRSNIFLPLSTAGELREHLNEFNEFYKSLGPPAASDGKNSPSDDGRLKSEIMIKDNRRYYLDLKENSRGRFLRISQTLGRGGPRSHIAIPAQGMVDFRNSLSDILDEFGTDDGGSQRELPEAQHLRVRGKGFHFDVGQNNRGVFMRISEVQGGYRSSITLPEKSWPRIRDIIDDFCEKMENNASIHSEGDEAPNSEEEGAEAEAEESQAKDDTKN